MLVVLALAERDLTAGQAQAEGQALTCRVQDLTAELCEPRLQAAALDLPVRIGVAANKREAQDLSDRADFLKREAKAASGNGSSGRIDGPQSGKAASKYAPPTWNDQVWLRWHANDGFLLDQYREEDENLLTLPDEESAS